MEWNESNKSALVRILEIHICYLGVLVAHPISYRWLLPWDSFFLFLANLISSYGDSSPWFFWEKKKKFSQQPQKNNCKVS